MEGPGCPQSCPSSSAIWVVVVGWGRSRISCVSRGHSPAVGRFPVALRGRSRRWLAAFRPASSFRGWSGGCRTRRGTRPADRSVSPPLVPITAAVAGCAAPRLAARPDRSGVISRGGAPGAQPGSLGRRRCGVPAFVSPIVNRDSHASRWPRHRPSRHRDPVSWLDRSTVSPFSNRCS